ncbi:hypothetical protein PG990_001333 [Apiospora arundinis]
MVLNVNPVKIRQNRSLGGVEGSLYSYAAELAVLGEVESARNLVSVLYKEGSPTGMFSHADRRLALAWEFSGQGPDGATEEGVRQTAEEMREVYGAVSSGKQITFDRKGLEKCLAILRNRSDIEKARGPDAIFVIALDISLGVNGDIQNHRTGTAMSLRSGTQIPKVPEEDMDARRLRVSNLDETSAELVKELVANWQKRPADYLLIAEKLWPYYCRGLFADATGISAEDLKSKGERLVQAFSDRLSCGYMANGLETKTTRDLLEIGEKNTLRGPGLEHWEASGDDIPETYFTQPVTSEQVAELEIRLETNLPQDYKEFLSITNGFGSGTVLEDGIYNGYFPDPELYAIDKVAWLSEEWVGLPCELLEIPREIEDPYRKEMKDWDSWDTAMPLFDRVVHVGRRDIDDLWLVPPKLVQEAKESYLKMLENGDEMQQKILRRAMGDFAGSMEAFESLEWCCVKNSSGGSACRTFYPSFRAYLEDVVDQSAECRASSR